MQNKEENGINEAWEMVKEFHIAFKNPIGEKASLLKKSRVKTRSKWMDEEIEEFKGASTIEDQVDAMIDLIYFALGTLVEIGVKPKKVFEIVHEANMKKIWEDGEVHYNKDGKVIKPNSWKDPKNEIALAIENE